MPPLPKNTKDKDPLKFVDQRYELIEIDAVRPYPGNPNEGDVGAVYHSQTVNGFYGVIYAQESTGFMLAGHTRYYAAVHHEAKQIPCIWLRVDDATALRIVAVDNRTRDLARYDDTALEELLARAIEDSGTLDGTGFDDEAFQDLQAQLSAPPGFGSGKGDRGAGQGSPDDGTETGQGGLGGEGPAEVPEDDQAGCLKRLGLNMLYPADYDAMLKAAETALERSGAKVANIKRRAEAKAREEGNPSPEYNPLTLGLIAVCVAYLEGAGVSV